MKFRPTNTFATMIGNLYKTFLGETHVIRHTNHNRAKRIFAGGGDVFILPKGEINRHSYGDSISAIKVLRQGLEMHLNDLDKMIATTLGRFNRNVKCFDYFEVINPSYQ